MAAQRLKFCQGEFVDEFRVGLKRHNLAALLWVPFFVVRRLILAACFVLMPSTIGSVTIYSVLSFLTVAYLAYIRPFTDNARNYFEIFNESLVYIVSFLTLCLQSMQGRMVDAHQYNEIGWSLVLII